MIKIICISEIINVPSFITAGLITHDLIYEMVYLYAKFLELLIHRLGLGGPQCVVKKFNKKVLSMMIFRTAYLPGRSVEENMSPDQVETKLIGRPPQNSCEQ